MRDYVREHTVSGFKGLRPNGRKASNEFEAIALRQQQLLRLHQSSAAGEAYRAQHMANPGSPTSEQPSGKEGQWI